MTPRPLADLQRWLLEAITDPSGDWDEAQLAALLPGPVQSRAERLEVYRSAYVGRLLEVLRDLCPCLRFAVGDEVFDRFAIGYLQAHPPHSYTLHDLADDFPAFLDRTRPAEEDWAAFAVQLARLELAIDQVFDGPGPEAIIKVTGTSVGSALRGVPCPALNHSLHLVPGFRLLSFTFPVSTYYTAWKAIRHSSGQSNEHPAWPQPEPQYVALLRRDYIVRRYELLPLQYQLLARLAAGDTLEAALGSIAGDEDVDALATQVRDWFTLWSRERFFLLPAEKDGLQ
jgi:hypothetical protein